MDSEGLAGLNRILLSRNGAKVCKVLKCIARAENHPIYIHCSHGKDRTGLMVGLVLRVLAPQKSPNSLC